MGRREWELIRANMEESERGCDVMERCCGEKEMECGRGKEWGGNMRQRRKEMSRYRDRGGGVGVVKRA